jgi:diaminopimelate epimerase
MKFTKMHGAGNDFLLVEGNEGRDCPALSQAMCERHLGAGADGVMLVLASAKADVRMRLFNADGSEAEVSGNGVRCLVRYAVERGLAAPKGGMVTIEAIHDVLEAEVEMDGPSVRRVRLSMGPPRFDPKEVPVAAEMSPPVIDLPIDVGGERIAVTCLSMGNPHAVTFIDGPVADYPLEIVGPKVEHHTAFPARVNFGVGRLLDGGRMELRVWERGCGETLACGSGSCAAMVAARLKGRAGDVVDITQPGGLLRVEWDGRGDVYLSGDAQFVFDGDWPD